jgi:hypothetical protein
VVAVAALLVSSLLLSSSIGSTALVDAKKSKHIGSNSNSASNSNGNNNSNGVITKFTIAADSGTTGKSLTVEQAILACPTSVNNPSAPASLKPWCDTFMTYIVDYCLNHMNDKGAKENFQVCYDTDLRNGMIDYLYKTDRVVDGKKPVEVSAELVSNAINNL